MTRFDREAVGIEPRVAKTNIIPILVSSETVGEATAQRLRTIPMIGHLKIPIGRHSTTATSTSGAGLVSGSDWSPLVTNDGIAFWEAGCLPVTDRYDPRRAGLVLRHPRA